MNNKQRDSQWANIPLGDGSTTIGISGCTISVIGDVLGITPDVVNSMLKAVNGFSKAWVVWYYANGVKPLEQAFPGITVNRIWTYNNDDVIAQLAAGNQVIVEVPAVPIGGTGSHWVQYIGNHQLKDPWTGTVRPTSDFPNPTGYAVFGGAWHKPTPTPPAVTAINADGLDTYGLDPTNEASNQVVFKTWNDVKNGLYIPVAQYNAVKASADDLQKQVDQLNSEHVADTKEIANLNSSLETLSGSNKNYANQALEAEKVATTYTGYMDDVATQLDIPQNNQTDAQLHDEIIKEIVQLHANQKTTESEVAPDKTLTTWENGFKNIVDWIIQHGLNDYLKENNLQVVDLDGNPQDDGIGDRVIAYLDDRFHRLDFLENAINNVKDKVEKSKNLFTQFLQLFIKSA